MTTTNTITPESRDTFSPFDKNVSPSIARLNWPADTHSYPAHPVSNPGNHTRTQHPDPAITRMDPSVSARNASAAS